MSEVEIRKATKEDAETILRIWQECADWFASKGLMHWKNANFSIQSILLSLEKEEIFLIFDKGVAVGTITISHFVPEWYEFDPSVFWKASGSAFYLKKLAVLPAHHSKGFASKLLEFAEHKARRENVKLLRFDAIIKGQDKLNSFYLKRGFRIMGQAITASENLSNFFEKQLGD